VGLEVSHEQSRRWRDFFPSWSTLAIPPGHIYPL
jgi:hypothetical protein